MLVQRVFIRLLWFYLLVYPVLSPDLQQVVRNLAAEDAGDALEAGDASKTELSPLK